MRRDDERIDYDELERLAHERKPKMIRAGASAYPRVIDFARIGETARAVGAAMVTDMAHIAGLVAAGVHPSPVPCSDVVTTTTHKTLRGPRGGMALCRADHAKNLNRALFPGVQGGPLMHVIAAKAVCLKEASEPGFAAYQRQVVANAQRLAAALAASGFRLVSGGTDNHLLLVDVFSQGLTGKVAEAALAAPHHGQQERHPVRREPAHGGERHTPGDAGAHHARHGRSRDGQHRRADRACAGRARGRAGGADGARRGRSALPAGFRCIRTRTSGPQRAAASRNRRERYRRRDARRAHSRGVRRRRAAGRRAAGVRAALRPAHHGRGGRGRPRRRRRAAGGGRTGTGKTLAYLVPAILSGRRVLVSTGTRNLQDQIFYKDLPALREALGVPFTAAYMKGRANYLCLQRFESVVEDGQPLGRADGAYLDAIREWAGQTETGDRAEVEDLPDDYPLWNEISAASENCIGSECPLYDDCFVTRMRRQALESDLVIVNHHLLCADAAVRQGAYGEVIPSCACTVIDEAHQLENVATQYFGTSISNYRLEDLARDGQRALAGSDPAGKADRDEARRCVDDVRYRGQCSPKRSETSFATEIECG